MLALRITITTRRVDVSKRDLSYPVMLKKKRMPFEVDLLGDWVRR